MAFGICQVDYGIDKHYIYDVIIRFSPILVINDDQLMVINSIKNKIKKNIKRK